MATSAPAGRSSSRTLTRHNDLVIAAGYEEALLTAGLDSLDGLFEAANTESLSKPGLGAWRERLRLTLDVAGEPQTVYLKRFRHPPPGARREVKRSGTGAASVAGMEWAWMRRLAFDGIACPRPIAFGEQLHEGREVRSAILIAAVPGCSLEYWVNQWSEADRTVMRSLLSPLAELVARLHERGYAHRDLYLSHVFHDPASPPGRSLHLIDLQRVIRPRRRRLRWIVKDLASLNFSSPAGTISRTDRLRWLTSYLGFFKLNVSVRRLVYLIVGKTEAIARRDRRRTARWLKGE